MCVCLCVCVCVCVCVCEKYPQYPISENDMVCRSMSKSSRNI